MIYSDNSQETIMVIQRVGYYSGIIHGSGVVQAENGEKWGDVTNLRYFLE